MYASRVLAFSDFLANEPKSYDNIARFLAINTFSEEQPSCIYLGELRDTGMVTKIGGFGWNSEELSEFVDLPIQLDIPLTLAIRTNKVQVYKNSEFFNYRYPQVHSFRFREEWLTRIGVPAYPVGVISIFSTLDIQVSDAGEDFYLTIGSLLGLYSSNQVKKQDLIFSSEIQLKVVPVPLSDRQLVIVGLLERGLSNEQIGLEIGYSTSMVRQETIVIYRNLKVHGRKELQAIHLTNQESERKRNTSLD